MDWLWIGIGIPLGIAAFVGLIYWLGSRLWQRVRFFRAVPEAADLPQPFPKDLVISRYIRRKREHQHDRHFYQRHAGKRHRRKRPV